MEPPTDKQARKTDQREALRRRLLQLIIKNEARRRGRPEASDK